MNRDDALREQIAELRRERERAEEREAAVRDVIQTIARSTFDLDAVLQTVIDRAVHLCHADVGNVARQDGDVYRVVAFTRVEPEYERLVRERLYPPERGSAIGRTVLERRVVHIVDVLDDPEYSLTALQRAGGYRTLLAAPMLREGAPIGAIAVGRKEVRPFSDAEIRLAVGELVIANHGTAEHFAGDGLMALFNDPAPIPEHQLAQSGTSSFSPRGSATQPVPARFCARRTHDPAALSITSG